MPNARHTSLMLSPSRRRPTKRTRSSITEHSFHGINTSRKAKSVTHVSGTFPHLCLGSFNFEPFSPQAPVALESPAFPRFSAEICVLAVAPNYAKRSPESPYSPTCVLRDLAHRLP